MKDVLKDVNLQKGLLGYLGHGATPFEQYRNLTLKDLSTNEGFLRLYNQELRLFKINQFSTKIFGNANKNECCSKKGRNGKNKKFKFNCKTKYFKS